MSEIEANRDDERDSESRSPFARGRRRVLVGAILFVVATSGLYAVSSRFLPPRIVEGPLVQLADEHNATLVWYVSRPLGAEVEVSVEGANATVQSDDRRCVAKITGLSPGRDYPYVIRSRGVELRKATLSSSKAPGAPFKFMVFGDSGSGWREQYRIAALMAAERPDLLVHSGDLVYNGGQRRNYKLKFFEPYREMIERVAFWPSLGNHDVADPAAGAAYREVFELPLNGPPGQPPENDYWFDYADARFAVLDSNALEIELHDAVAPWLTHLFTDCDKTWRFVVFHHPPYTAGAHEPSEKIQRALVPVFDAVGVDVVFNGHDHLYERTAPMRDGSIAPDGKGVAYIVTGAGGAELYEPAASRPAHIVAASSAKHSYTRVEVDGKTLKLAQIDIDGATLDTFSITK